MRGRIQEANSVAMVSSVASGGRKHHVSSCIPYLGTTLSQCCQKHEDLRMFNILDIHMPSDKIVEFQKRMMRALNQKMCPWKKEIKKVKVLSLLLNKV